MWQGQNATHASDRESAKAIASNLVLPQKYSIEQIEKQFSGNPYLCKKPIVEAEINPSKAMLIETGQIIPQDLKQIISNNVQNNLSELSIQESDFSIRSKSNNPLMKKGRNLMLNKLNLIDITKPGAKQEILTSIKNIAKNEGNIRKVEEQQINIIQVDYLSNLSKQVKQCPSALLSRKFVQKLKEFETKKRQNDLGEFNHDNLFNNEFSNFKNSFIKEDTDLTQIDQNQALKVQSQDKLLSIMTSTPLLFKDQMKKKFAFNAITPVDQLDNQKNTEPFELGELFDVSQYTQESKVSYQKLKHHYKNQNFNLSVNKQFKNPQSDSLKNKKLTLLDMSRCDSKESLRSVSTKQYTNATTSNCQSIRKQSDLYSARSSNALPQLNSRKASDQFNISVQNSEISISNQERQSKYNILNSNSNDSKTFQLQKLKSIEMQSKAALSNTNLQSYKNLYGNQFDTILSQRSCSTQVHSKICRQPENQSPVSQARSQPQNPCKIQNQSISQTRILSKPSQEQLRINKNKVTLLSNEPEDSMDVYSNKFLQKQQCWLLNEVKTIDHNYQKLNFAAIQPVNQYAKQKDLGRIKLNYAQLQRSAQNQIKFSSNIM